MNSNKVSPKWILLAAFFGILVGFIVGVMSAPTFIWSFDVLPIVFWSGPIVIVLCLIYLYLIVWRKEKKE